jgi:hypothetical protein
MLHRSSLAATLAAAALIAAPAGANADTLSGPPPPVFPSDGLHVVHDRRGESILRFTGASALRKARKWRGKQLQVTCDWVPARSYSDGGIVAGSAQPAGGFNGRSLRIGQVGRTRDYCVVRYEPSRRSPSQLVAVAPVSAEGRAWVTDLEASVPLLNIGYPDDTPAGQVPNVDAMVDEWKPLIVALPDPAAMPPTGKIGYWSDGAHHDVLAVRSETGRRLFVENDADVVRSNMLQFLFFFESD